MTTTKAKHAAQQAEDHASLSSAGAPTEAQTPAAAAATDAGVAAALVPAKAQAPKPDEHHGKGGLYRLVNGKRELVQQTKAEVEAEAETKTEAAAD